MAKLDVMLWNQDRTESVRASKIRSFGIYDEGLTNRFKLLGWYNNSDSFYFGNWETKQQAQMFLTDIHKQIEGR